MSDHPEAASSPTYRLDGEIAVITLDDGKANAIGHDLIAQLHGLLDRASSEARAVVICGRPGRFSAGFDLAVMNESVEAVRELVSAGAELLARLYGFGLPTLAACTGHALAAGALLLLATDVRIGADVPAKIGLNEVAIGMQLPIFGVELARERLASPAVFNESVLQARIYDPAEAVGAGYLDQVVPAEGLLEEALSQARRLAAFRSGAYAATKLNARRAVIDRIRSTLAADMASIGGPDPAP